MKAAVVPALHSQWRIQEVPKPEPGPNQVLIRIRASGICYTDVHQTKGDLPGNFPRILGHEPVGEIVAVGPGVTARKVGDRVGVPWIQTTCGRCEWCKRGKPMFCEQQVGTSGAAQGGHAEYMLAFAGATMLLPDGLSYEQAAPIFCAGYTVWSGLRWADPQPGERVAVVGIGGLGHLAVQYAKAAGFDTIAISRSPDKDTLIRQLGADRAARGQQLGALLEPGDRRPAQQLRDDAAHRHGQAAEHSQPASAGHAQGRADHPGHRRGRLVPVEHQELHRLADATQLVRPASCVRGARLGPGAAPPRPKGLARS